MKTSGDWDDPTYTVEECCKEMEYEFRFKERYEMDLGIVYIKFQSTQQVARYCPFCGQKFNITSKAIFT